MEGRHCRWEIKGVKFEYFLPISVEMGSRALVSPELDRGSSITRIRATYLPEGKAILKVRAIAPTQRIFPGWTLDCAPAHVTMDCSRAEG
jgi:hypothetical protein